MTSYFRAFKKENDVVELGYTEYKICIIHYGKFAGYKVINNNNLENVGFIRTIL